MTLLLQQVLRQRSGERWIAGHTKCVTLTLETSVYVVSVLVYFNHEADLNFNFLHQAFNTQFFLANKMCLIWQLTVSPQFGLLQPLYSAAAAAAAAQQINMLQNPLSPQVKPVLLI